MKDPAFLFYSSDFLTGTLAMDFEDRGKYITLLCYQHQHGRMEEKTIRFLVGSVSVNLKSKFRIDDDGLWYNERLEIEAKKRSKFTESRRKNGSKGGRPKKNKQKTVKNHMDNHMEDVNENVIVNKNIDIIVSYLNEKSEKNFRSSSKKTKESINARMNEGFTVDDFKYVIDVKCAEWMGTEHEQYLRPETLFSPSKFESYLNQKLNEKRIIKNREQEFNQAIRDTDLYKSL